MTFLVSDGFLFKQLGELSWQGVTDALRLAGFALAASGDNGAGVVYRLAPAMANQDSVSEGSDRKEWRGG